ncbi:hypothetical protein PGT21_016722 [Puccinia graminis f. sp. tritici]|uniref:Uncharacterized protein n=1 Tax=Puccinia graminis f. sp. tritici TaxID=56615 RepID=A0A5B0LW02_PUCGR|nr:hypothetical protein PGT21_016722 [Puccinia graminis f. sp. tritici]
MPAMKITNHQEGKIPFDGGRESYPSGGRQWYQPSTKDCLLLDDQYNTILTIDDYRGVERF